MTVIKMGGDLSKITRHVIESFRRDWKFPWFLLCLKCIRHDCATLCNGGRAKVQKIIPSAVDDPQLLKDAFKIGTRRWCGPRRFGEFLYEF